MQGSHSPAKTSWGWRCASLWQQLLAQSLGVNRWAIINTHETKCSGVGPPTVELPRLSQRNFTHQKVPWVWMKQAPPSLGVTELANNKGRSGWQMWGMGASKTRYLKYNSVPVPNVVLQPISWPSSVYLTPTQAEQEAPQVGNWVTDHAFCKEENSSND